MLNNPSFVCHCSHIEQQKNIHAIANPQQTMIIDLCEKCWQAADLEINNNPPLATWQFKTEAEFNTYNIAH